MKFNLYLNREPLPDAVGPGDVLPGVQIAPIGEWPHGETMQHVTADAIEGMLAAWRDGGSKDVLCDFDHDAEDGGPTKAAAWISNLRLDPERGLVGDFALTDAGADAVASRRYRFLSPCWEVNVDRWRGKGEGRTPAEVTPARLVSVALTNKPNIPMEPVLNRAPEGVVSVQRKEINMDPAKIKEALGLAPDATEEDILAALGKLKAENEAYAAEKAEAEKAAAEKEADEFAEANARKCNRDVVRAQYLANREATIALVNAIPEQKAPAAPPVCNRAEAKTPSSFENAGVSATSPEAILERYENMSPGKDKDEFLMANAIAINRARIARDAAQ